MTGEEVQLWTAVGGFVTTLVAVVLTWLLIQRAETKRFTREEARRWQDVRLRLISEFQAWGLEMEKRVSSAAQGYRVYRHRQTKGAPPDDTDFEIGVLNEITALETEWRDALIVEGERMVHDLELVVTNSVNEAAWWLLSCYGQVIAELAAMVPQEEVEALVEQISDARDGLMIAARQMLTPDGAE